MTSPTVLDLFCGAAGGWSLGLHRAGYRTIAAAECDPWRRAAFSANFPEVRLYDDVRDVTAARLLDDLGHLPDVVVGSPPCQDISAANPRGAGIGGERSGLFWEWLRVIDEVRPRWACGENSPRFRTRGYDAIASGLEAIGYTVWPLVVGAVDAGAPHKRKRVWVVAADADGREQNKPRGDAIRCGLLVERPSPVYFADTDRPARPHGGVRRAEQRDLQPVETAGDWPLSAAIGEATGWNGGPPRFGRVDDGLPRGVARACISAYGDAVVPQITEAIGRAILSVEATMPMVGEAA